MLVISHCFVCSFVGQFCFLSFSGTFWDPFFFLPGCWDCVGV